VTFYSRSRVSLILALFNIGIILALLTIPVYVLLVIVNGAHVSLSVVRVDGVIMVFTLILTAVLTIFTQAKRHEILTSAGAYVLYALPWKCETSKSADSFQILWLISCFPY
jgi:hypothetical protein